MTQIGNPRQNFPYLKRHWGETSVSFGRLELFTVVLAPGGGGTYNIRDTVCAAPKGIIFKIVKYTVRVCFSAFLTKRHCKVGGDH